MHERKVLYSLLCCCMLCGCMRRVTMPLCAAVALKSYAPGVPPAPGTVVNAFLAQQATKGDVKLNVLSPVAVELAGRKRDVRRLEQNYRFFLCAFYDPRAPTDYAQIYTTCLKSAPMWTQIVQSSKPEDLLLPRTNYANVCVQGASASGSALSGDGVIHP
jgi:hypothetical protein